MLSLFTYLKPKYAYGTVTPTHKWWGLQWFETDVNRINDGSYSLVHTALAKCSHLISSSFFAFIFSSFLLILFYLLITRWYTCEIITIASTLQLSHFKINFVKGKGNNRHICWPTLGLLQRLINLHRRSLSSQDRKIDSPRQLYPRVHFTFCKCVERVVGEGEKISLIYWGQCSLQKTKTKSLLIIYPYIE